METIILKVDTKSNAKKLYESLHLLHGVKEVSMIAKNKRGDLMDEIEVSLKQVKMIQNGDLKGRSLKQILNGK